MALRPVLPPGAHVVRRDERTLLVGSAPGVPVADRPGLLQVLRLLDGRTVESLAALAAERVPQFEDDVTTTVHELLARGALVTSEPAAPHLTVRVLGRRGAGAETAVVDAAVDHLGLRDSAETSVLVLVSVGEPPRSWVRDAAHGTPVLPVVLDARRARVGPLTMLGTTPCLDCFDAEQARWDPAWGAVLPQLGRPLVPAPPGRPPTALLWRTAALVADELRSVATGATPATLGAVVVLDGRDEERRPVTFSSRCGCLP